MEQSNDILLAWLEKHTYQIGFLSFIQDTRTG